MIIDHTGISGSRTAYMLAAGSYIFWGTMSELLGIQSAANFVFLFMIFVVLVKLFNMAIEVSIQKQRLNRLIQKLALSDKDLNDKDN